MSLQQITIVFILIIAFIGAIVIFIRTPKEQRYSYQRVDIKGEDYAPEYSNKERVHLAIKHLAWAVPFIVVINYYLRLAFDTYVVNASCYSYTFFENIHFTGIHVVWYGIFFGLPMMFALILFILEGPRSISVIKLGQSPLPGEKVLRPTKYRYGARAKIRPLLFLVGLAFVIALSIYGLYKVNKMLSNTSDKAHIVCVIK